MTLLEGSLYEKEEGDNESDGAYVVQCHWLEKKCMDNHSFYYVNIDV